MRVGDEGMKFVTGFGLIWPGKFLSRPKAKGRHPLRSALAASDVLLAFAASQVGGVKISGSPQGKCPSPVKWAPPRSGVGDGRTPATCGVTLTPGGGW